MTSREWAAAAALLAVATSVASGVHAGDVMDGDVLAVARKHFASKLRRAAQAGCAGIDRGVKGLGAQILEQVLWDRNMPIGNDTGMTEEERALLERWIETLK